MNKSNIAKPEGHNELASQIARISSTTTNKVKLGSFKDEAAVLTVL